MSDRLCIFHFIVFLALLEACGSQCAARPLVNLLVVHYLQMWILAAQFEVRQQRLDAARKILGMSLGMCPKDRTYKAYIEVSTALEYQIDITTSCTDQAQCSVAAAFPYVCNHPNGIATLTCRRSSLCG